MLQRTRVCCAPTITPHWHARISETVSLPMYQTHRLRDQTLSVTVHSLVRPEQEHCALLASTRGQCLFGVSSCSPTLYRACVAVDVAQRPLGVGSASCRARSVQLMRITSCMQGVGWGGNTLMFQRLRPSGRSWPATFAVRLIDSSTILPDRMRLCIVPVVSSVEGIVQQPYMRLW
jgi:hypothetical protein